MNIYVRVYAFNSFTIATFHCTVITLLSHFSTVNDFREGPTALTPLLRSNFSLAAPVPNSERMTCLYRNQYEWNGVWPPDVPGWILCAQRGGECGSRLRSSRLSHAKPRTLPHSQTDHKCFPLYAIYHFPLSPEVPAVWPLDFRSS